MLTSPDDSEGVEVQEDHHEVVTGRDDSEGVEVQEDFFQNKCGPVAQVGGSTLVMQMCCSWN